MNTEGTPPPEGYALPRGATPTDPPAWRWIFTLTEYGCTPGWRPPCKVLLLVGVPLGLLILLTMITGPWGALSSGVALGGMTWLRRWHLQRGLRRGGADDAPDALP